MPTPYPARKPPTTNKGMAADTVCKVTPRRKTWQGAIGRPRRPTRSGAGAAESAPKKVPAERMDTIKDFWLEVISGNRVTGLMNPVENLFFHCCIARMPLILPVSYLHRFN